MLALTFTDEENDFCRLLLKSDRFFSAWQLFHSLVMVNP